MSTGYRPSPDNIRFHSSNAHIRFVSSFIHDSRRISIWLYARIAPADYTGMVFDPAAYVPGERYFTLFRWIRRRVGYDRQFAWLLYSHLPVSNQPLFYQKAGNLCYLQRENLSGVLVNSVSSNDASFLVASSNWVLLSTARLTARESILLVLRSRSIVMVRSLREPLN